MHNIHKSAIVSYSCEQMYQLINNINDYPQFLNWCCNATILNQTPTQITASLTINKGMFKQSFTTINQLIPNERINMSLKDGPFERLNGIWEFTKLNDSCCKINFSLEFKFASKLLDISISKIFTDIANSQIDAFTKRAQQIYSK